MCARVGMEIRYAQYREARPLAAQVTFVSAQEELARKEIMPGVLGNHLDGHTIVGIGPGSRIQYVDIAPLQICSQVLAHILKGLWRHRMVYIAPPDFGGVR